MTRLQTLHCAYSVENRLLKKTENSKIKTAKHIQNVKEAAKGRNVYKMSELWSNATLIDKAVYHSGYITTYLLTRTPGTSYESFAVWLGKKTDHSNLFTCKVKCHLTFYKILFAPVKVKQSVQVAVCFEQGLSFTDLCPCETGKICRNSNTQMSRNKSIDYDDVDLLQLDVQE